MPGDIPFQRQAALFTTAVDYCSGKYHSPTIPSSLAFDLNKRKKTATRPRTTLIIIIIIIIIIINNNDDDDDDEDDDNNNNNNNSNTSNNNNSFLCYLTPMHPFLLTL